MGKIIVKNLCKAYKQYPSNYSRLIEWLLPFLGTRHALNWVLNDISFEVNTGESMGVIGMNGAGKSTLLKIISGITQPSVGEIKLEGRIVALLELGIGFHAEFTGRQNVIMAGQLLGISLKDIEIKIPEIMDFAEIGDYIDLPVRVYSSGMQVRLAFSVATVIRPDILIIDEALSVGDAQFQHKSFARINEYKRLGTTLFIVSHDVQAILNICDKAILLDNGNMVVKGDPESVLNHYNEILYRKKNNINLKIQDKKSNIKEKKKFGTGEAQIDAIEIINENGELTESVEVGEKISLKVTAKANVNLSSIALGYIIKDRLGQPIYGTNTLNLGLKSIYLKEGKKMEFIISFTVGIGVGLYSISVALHRENQELNSNYTWIDQAIYFSVVNSRYPSFMGLAWLEPVCTLKELDVT